MGRFNIQVAILPKFICKRNPNQNFSCPFCRTGQAVPKICTKTQEIQITKTILKKKKLENSSFPFHTILQSYNNQQCGTSTVLETQIDGIKLKVRNKLFFIFTFKWFFTRVPRPFTLGKWEKNSFFSSDSTTG